MLLLPQMVIWKLRLATKQKVGVSVVFSGGAMYVTLHLVTVRNYIVLIVKPALVSGQLVESRLPFISAYLETQPVRIVSICE